MRRMNWAVAIFVFICGLVVASANQSLAGTSEYYSRGAAGILRMKHSPVLGINIPINVWIDGRQQGSFAKGHVFERSLAPGRHDLYASRPGQLYSSFFGTLDVSPGQTYSFVVKSTPNQIYLVPVGRID
jgi:hypothetical protein